MIRASWTSGASIEVTRELWASSLREVKGRMRPLFTQEREAASAGAFLDGLLGAERRKTGWMRADAAGDPGPWRQQAVLGRGRWDADALRDDDRQVTSGILHVLTSGCRWRDCPAAYGPRTSVYNRFNGWSRRGFGRAMLSALAKAGRAGDAVALDSTYVRAHRSAHGGKGD